MFGVNQWKVEDARRTKPTTSRNPEKASSQTPRIRREAPLRAEYACHDPSLWDVLGFGGAGAYSLPYPTLYSR